MQDNRHFLRGSGYLCQCLKKQREVAKALFNQDQDLRKIEELAADIRLSSNLTYENVRKIANVGLWSGRGFWQWPNVEEFNDRLEQHPVGDLSTELPEREKHIVDQLLRVFRHIEPVSVVIAVESVEQRPQGGSKPEPGQPGAVRCVRRAAAIGRRGRAAGR